MITKGTIIIKGDRVEVQDPEGYQYATSFGSGKKHATFRQKREGLDEYIDGDAERIDYDGKQDLTTLTTAATVRRLQGTSTVADTVHGSVITYDGQRDFYTAKGGRTSPRRATNGRVRAMLSPKNGGPAPLNGAPAKLSPSTTIQGRRANERATEPPAGRHDGSLVVRNLKKRYGSRTVVRTCRST